MAFLLVNNNATQNLSVMSLMVDLIEATVVERSYVKRVARGSMPGSGQWFSVILVTTT